MRRIDTLGVIFVNGVAAGNEKGRNRGVGWEGLLGRGEGEGRGR